MQPDIAIQNAATVRTVGDMRQRMQQAARSAATQEPARDHAADAATTFAVRKTTAVMAMAGLTMLFLNSDGLRSWVYDLPPGAISDGLVVAVEHWHRAMETLGFADAKSIVGDAAQALRKLSW